MMTKETRRQRRRRQEKERQEAERLAQEQAREAVEKQQDDLSQAVVTRKGELYCEALNCDLRFSALSIGEQSALKDEALRHFRREQLTMLIDELNTLRDSNAISKEQYDKELNEARAENRKLSFDDMPHKTIEYEDARGKVVRQTVPYQQYFMAATSEGQLSAVYLSIQAHHPAITKAELRHVMGSDPDFFIDAATTIAEITKSLIAKKSKRRGRR